MGSGVRKFVRTWMREHNYDIRNYAGEGDTRRENEAWIGDIAYDMKSDFKKQHGNMCPKGCDFDAWYDDFVDMFIMPILAEMKRAW